MTAQALLESLAEFEYAKPCHCCDNTAEWMTWVAHGEGCQPNAGAVCTSCKTEVEEYWAHIILHTISCACGWFPQGLLEDNCRSVRL